MAFVSRTLPTNTVEEQELVKPGQIVNGLSCTFVPRGLPYMVRFGGNAPSGPYTGKTTWTIGPGTPEADVRWGIFVRMLATAPSDVIVFQVAFVSTAGA